MIISRSFSDAALQVQALKPSKYEPILKEPLICFHCQSEIKNIPVLKKHLEEEWDKLERRGREGRAGERKVEGPNT